MPQLPKLGNIERMKQMILNNQNPYALYPEIGKKVNQFGDKYIRPVSDVVNSIMQPIDAETGLPNVDIAGPVINAANSKNIQKAIEFVQKHVPNNAVDAAIAYTKFKYPKLTKIPTVLDSIKATLGDRPSGTQAYYNPKQNSAFVLKNTTNKMDRAVNAAMHEIQHAYQNIKKGRTKELTLPKEGGTYITPNLTPEELAALPDDSKIIKEARIQRFQDYEAQPVEVEARQAGQTAQNTINKIIQGIAEKNVFDLDQPLTKDIWRDVIQDYVMQSYQQNLKAAKNPELTKYSKMTVEERINKLNSLFKTRLDKASAFLTKGNAYANESWYDERFSPPSKLLVRDLISNYSDVNLMELLKSKGYTGYIDPWSLTENKLVPLKTLEDIFGMR